MQDDKTPTPDSLEDRLLARLDAIEQRFNERLSLIEGRADARWQETRSALSQMLVVITALNENAREVNRRLAEIGEGVGLTEEELLSIKRTQQHIALRLGALEGPKKQVAPILPPPPRFR